MFSHPSHHHPASRPLHTPSHHAKYTSSWRYLLRHCFNHVSNPIIFALVASYILFFPRVTNTPTSISACHNLHGYSYIHIHRGRICPGYVNRVRQTSPMLCVRRLTFHSLHDTLLAFVIPSFIRLYKSSLFHAYIRSQ